MMPAGRRAGRRAGRQADGQQGAEQAYLAHPLISLDHQQRHAANDVCTGGEYKYAGAGYAPGSGDMNWRHMVSGQGSTTVRCCVMAHRELSTWQNWSTGAPTCHIKEVEEDDDHNKACLHWGVGVQVACAREQGRRHRTGQLKGVTVGDVW